MSQELCSKKLGSGLFLRVSSHSPILLRNSTGLRGFVTLTLRETPRVKLHKFSCCNIFVLRSGQAGKLPVGVATSDKMNFVSVFLFPRFSLTLSISLIRTYTFTISLFSPSIRYQTVCSTFSSPFYVINSETELIDKPSLSWSFFYTFFSWIILCCAFVVNRLFLHKRRIWIHLRISILIK